MKGDLVVGGDLVIEGTYDGTISARDTVVLRRTARLSGEVSATCVEIENGTNLENTVLSGRICLAGD
jgi:cytoskeletal protein CcmA (bactofilin family)